jgi:hypothetical protein
MGWKTQRNNVIIPTMSDKSLRNMSFMSIHCDYRTLTWIREFWISYATSDLTKDEKVTYDRRFKSNIQKAIDAKVGFLGDTGLVLTGYRSTTPTSIQSIKDLPKLYEYYWDHGSTDGDPNSLSKAKHTNPTFAPLETDIADSLLGFHFATAYAPLTPESTLHLESPGLT